MKNKKLKHLLCFYYKYTVQFSLEDNCFIGTVEEFPSLSACEDTYENAFEGILDLVEDIVLDLERMKEIVPVPLSLKETESLNGK